MFNFEEYKKHQLKSPPESKKAYEKNRIEQLINTIYRHIQLNFLEEEIESIIEWTEELNDRLFNYKYEFVEPEKKKQPKEKEKQPLFSDDLYSLEMENDMDMMVNMHCRDYAPDPSNFTTFEEELKKL